MVDVDAILKSMDHGAVKTVVLASEEMRYFCGEEISPELLFLGLVKDIRSKPGLVLNALGVTIKKARSPFKKLAKGTTATGADHGFSQHCIHLLRDARALADSSQQVSVTSGDAYSGQLQTTQNHLVTIALCSPCLSSSACLALIVKVCSET